MKRSNILLMAMLMVIGTSAIYGKQHDAPAYCTCNSNGTMKTSPANKIDAAQCMAYCEKIKN